MALRLIEHGPRIAVALVALSSLLAAAGGASLRGWWSAAALRRRLRSMGVPPAALDPGRAAAVALEGRLEGDGAGVLVATGYSARAAGDPTPAETSWRAAGLVLVTPHGRVSLEGSVHARDGRRTSNDPHLPMPDEGSFARVITASAGDVVRVSGVVEAVSARDAHGQGYRDATTAWRLSPGGDGAIPLRVASLRATPAGVAARALHGALGGITAFAALTLLGLFALTRADALRGAVDASGARPLCAGAGEGWGAVAAASPLTRRRALDGLQLTLGCKETRRLDDVLALDRVLQVAARGDATALCLERAGAFARATRYERAAALYETCGTPAASRLAATNWAYVGRYDRASALAKPWTQDVSSVEELSYDFATWHIVAGDLPAARAALERAAVLLDRPHTERPRRWVFRSHRGDALAVLCALDILRRRTGEAPALRAGCEQYDTTPTRVGRCEDERTLEALDARDEGFIADRVVGAVGREALRDALTRHDSRAALRALRREEPRVARRLAADVVRRGVRTEEDRVRVRAWAETEFPHDAGVRYDAGTVRWIAGAIDDDALLAEARAIGVRQCAADGIEATDPALRTLSQQW
jgi:hypothetical protein